MIPNFENLVSLFQKMDQNGFNTGQALKWGFFFVDDGPLRLQQVFSEVEEHGYVLEDLYETEDGDWMLHISKVEVLSVEKLHKRNIAFNELAAYCSIKYYDGWDVGQI